MQHLEVSGAVRHTHTYIYVVRQLRVNKIQQDATVCRYLFIVKSLYKYRVSIAPIIRSTKTVTAASGTGHIT